MKRIFVITLSLLSYCCLGQSKHPKPEDFFKSIKVPERLKCYANMYGLPTNIYYLQDSISFLLKMCKAEDDEGKQISQPIDSLFELKTSNGNILRWWTGIVTMPIGLNKYFFISNADSLTCIDKRNGRANWTAPAPGEYKMGCEANSIINLYEQGKGIIAIDKTGKILYEKAIPGLVNIRYMHGDNIISGSSKYAWGMCCTSISTGKELWKIKDNNTTIFSFSGDTMFFVSNYLDGIEEDTSYKQSITAVKISTGEQKTYSLTKHWLDGETRWKFPDNDTVLYSLVTAGKDKALYLEQTDLLYDSTHQYWRYFTDKDYTYLTFNSVILCFNRLTGQMAWKKDLGNGEIRACWSTKYFFIAGVLGPFGKSDSTFNPYFIVIDKSKPNNSYKQLIGNFKYILEDYPTLYVVRKNDEIFYLDLPQ